MIGSCDEVCFGLSILSMIDNTFDISLDDIAVTSGGGQLL